MTKEEAIELVGGKRDYILCFSEAGNMGVCEDWTWKEFEKALDTAEKIVMPDELNRTLGFSLFVKLDGKHLVFGSKND